MMTKRPLGLTWTVLLTIATSASGQAKPVDWKRLPAKIAKRCHTPVEWVTVSGEDEVHVQPSADGDFGKVDCVLTQLKKSSGIKLGFVGNEMDPKAALSIPYSYLAEGPNAQIEMLSAAAAKTEGWIVVRTAKAEDGTSYVEFRTRSGETGGGADKLMQRIWKKEFGDLALGNTPHRLSEPDNLDQ